MFSKNIYTWEGLENLMVKGDPWKRAWDHSCLANFYFQGTNCRAGWRDLPLLSSCCQPQESYQRDLHGDSQSELWRCVLLTATMPWRVWSKPFSSFSQCGCREQVQVKQNKTQKKHHFSFSRVSLTHYKNTIEAAVRMQSIRPQTSWQIRRGVFWLGKADIK